MSENEILEGLVKPASPVAFFADSLGTIEKARVAAQVRLSHLKRQGREDPDTKELLRLTRGVEQFVTGRLEEWVGQHPTAYWWQGIEGTSLKLMGRVIGLIDKFGCFYPVGDSWIPSYVQREPVESDGNQWVWVEGIERLTTPSKLHKYAGMAPGQKKVSSKLLDFNGELRTVLFRLFQFGFMMNQNKYYDQYIRYKEYKQRMYQAEGIKILPTPPGRYCPACDEEKDVRATTHFCPDCGNQLFRKQEPPGVIFAGHLDMMCRRRAIKLFLDHLWVVWREALGLPLRQPYPVEYLGHSQVLTPWDMVDN